MKNNLIFTLLLFFQLVNAQESDNRIYSFEINEIMFYKYNSNFQIKATKDFNTIKNEFPEDLMQSLLSCSSKEWEIFNALDGKAIIRNKDYYDNVKKMNIDKNYFELKHKIQFKIAGISTVILKFYFITQDNSNPQAGIIVMQNYNNRWYKTSMKIISNIALVTLRLKSDEFEKILFEDTSNTRLLEIHKKVFVNGILDFNSLNKEIDSWYIDKTKENISKKEFFKDPNSIL